MASQQQEQSNRKPKDDVFGDYFEVPISRAGGFFRDSAFQDNRESYHDAIKNVLHNWNNKETSFFNDNNDHVNKLFEKRQQDRQKNKEDRHKRFSEFFEGWDDDWDSFSNFRNEPKNFPSFNENQEMQNNCWSEQNQSRSSQSQETGGNEGGQKSFNSLKTTYQCQKSSSCSKGSNQNKVSEEDLLNDCKINKSSLDKSKEDSCKFNYGGMDSKYCDKEACDGFTDANHKIIEENLDSFDDNEMKSLDLEKKNPENKETVKETTEVFRNVGVDCQTQTTDSTNENENHGYSSDKKIFKMSDLESSLYDEPDDTELYRKGKTSRVTWGDDEVDEFIDDYSDYRDLRQTLPKHDTYASHMKEENLSHKIVLDVQEYKKGDVKVRVLSSTEIIVECWAERLEGTKRVKLTYTKPFKFDDPIDVSGVTSVMSSDGVLTITVPKKIGRSSTPYKSCLKNKDIF